MENGGQNPLQCRPELKLQEQTLRVRKQVCREEKIARVGERQRCKAVSERIRDNGCCSRQCPYLAPLSKRPGWLRWLWALYLFNKLSFKRTGLSGSLSIFCIQTKCEEQLVTEQVVEQTVSAWIWDVEKEGSCKQSPRRNKLEASHLSVTKLESLGFVFTAHLLCYSHLSGGNFPDWVSDLARMS